MGVSVFALMGLVLNLIFPTLIGGVFLRAAVALYNKLQPNYLQDDSPEEGLDENQQNELALGAQAAVRETDNPYATPQMIEVVAAAMTVAIPEPSYLKACGICFIVMIANTIAIFLIGIVTGFFGQTLNGAVISSLILTVSFFTLVVVLKLMLPTSFGRSAWVSAAFIGVAFFALLLIGLVVMGLMSGFES